MRFLLLTKFGKFPTLSSLSSQPQLRTRPVEGLWGNRQGTFRRAQHRLWGTTGATLSQLRKYQVGDEVFWTEENNLVKDGEALTQSGVIVEIRRGGWYTLRPKNDDSDSSKNLVKKRSSQLVPSLSLSSEESPSLSSLSSSAPSPPFIPPQPPAPSIVDLDAAFLQQPGHNDEASFPDHQLQKMVRLTQNITQWVVFTDLHCSSSTLDTCLEVLDRVHEEAHRREAGILFLGDFWHHRMTLRVDCLNAVRAALEKWTQPCLMIPGNHDQVSFATQHCYNHALQPLETANSVIFSQPTLLHGALFVPHIRDVAVLESILLATWPSSPLVQDDENKIQALFLHADVTGASMNDLMVSQGGIHPSVLPPNVSAIYSGHFHKPHTASRVHYVGSPYQVSLAEAQQDKALVVLDSTRQWQVVEEVPLDMGRRFFHGTSFQQVYTWAQERLNTTHDCRHVPRSGDRIVWTLSSHDKALMQGQEVDKDETSNLLVEETLATLRNDNITVDIREVKSNPFARNAPDNDEVDDDDPNAWLWEDLLSPTSVWESYLRSTTVGSAEKKDDSTTTSLEFHALWEAGRAILDGCVTDVMNDGGEEFMTTASTKSTLSASTTLELDSVTLQGFGSFRNEVTYPLSNRGLVLLRGNNLDGGSDSNGSGKSTLAMAALWALTGSMDARPVQDGKVSDVVNDESTKAQVTLRGRVNGEDFVVQRTKTAKKSHVLLHIAEEDLTRQSAKETQQALEEQLLGVGGDGSSSSASELLTRTIFHGQHALSGLLEATDAQFKDDLSLLLPLDTWQEAASTARSQAKLANKKASELEGKTNLRSRDEEALQRECNLAQVQVDERLALEEEVGRARQKEQENQHVAVGTLEGAVQQAQDEWKIASERVQSLEGNLTDLSSRRNVALKDAQQGFQNATAAWGEARVHHEGNNQRFQQAQLVHDGAVAALEAFVKDWGIVLENGNSPTVVSFAPPDVCPTCRQPLVSGQHDHSNTDMLATLQADVTRISNSIASAVASLEEYQGLCEESRRAITESESEMASAQKQLKELESHWVLELTRLEEDLRSARKDVAAASTAVSQSMAALQRQLQEEMRKEAEWNKRQEDVLRAQQELRKVQKQLEDMQREVNEWKQQRQEFLEQASLLSRLEKAFGPRGVQSFVLQNAISALETSSQYYLQDLSDGTLKLHLQLDSTSASGGERIVRTVSTKTDGASSAWTERPLSSLSGGQWRRCSLALAFGFANLVALRGQLRPSLWVLDEPLTHLDYEGRAQVGRLLRQLSLPSSEGSGSNKASCRPSTILVILQDLAAEEMEESFHAMDQVTRQNGHSTVHVDNGRDGDVVAVVAVVDGSIGKTIATTGTNTAVGIVVEKGSGVMAK